jgi:hypothetical protein
MDLPLIAQIDLPIDAVGSYLMTIAIDDEHTTEVPVQVRTSAQAGQPGPGQLMS